MLTEIEGELAVHLARDTIETFLQSGEMINSSGVDS